MLESSQRLRELDLFKRKLKVSPNGRFYNPLKFSLPDGDLAVLDDLFSFREYNNFLKHFSGAGAIGNPQAGVIQHITGSDIWRGYKTAAAWIDLVTDPLASELDAGANSIGFTQQTIAYAAPTTTVDWKLGNKGKMTFGAGNITTFAFTNPTKPGNFILVVVQDGVGGRTITNWDVDILWPNGVVPTLSAGAGAVDLFAFYWDGTNYFGLGSLNFS